MAPADFLEYLDDAVRTTEYCCHSIDSSISRLTPGVEDLPRLSKVLFNEHRFLVLPAPTVQAHKAALSRALAPQIEALMAKAEAAIQAQQQKVQRLEERLQLFTTAQESAQAAPAPSYGHLGEGEGDEEGEAEGEVEDALRSKIQGIDEAGLSAGQKRKLIMLRAKRKALEAQKARLKSGQGLTE